MSRMRYVSGVVLVIFAVGALVASAAGATKYVDSFFGNPTATTGTTGGLFNTPGGVAVNDATGAIYVVDRSNNRIQQFDAANNFVRAWGRDVVATGADQADEQQSLTVAATAGQFRLTFGADTTGDIAFDAPAADVQTALNGLTSINAGGGSVTVTGGPGNAGGTAPYVISFAGARADVNQAAIVTSAGTTPLTGSATVATINDGAVGFEICGTAANCKTGVNTGSAGGDFNTPQGIAVNQSTGHVYVTDGGRLRVQEFTATGQFARAWGKDVVATGAPNNVSTTAFEICDASAGNFLNQCKTGVTGGEAGTFASTFSGYPAVAPAGAPNAGNVLVADSGNRRVQEFTLSGGFVRTFGFDVDSVSASTGFEICTTAANCKTGVAGSAIGQFATNQPVRVMADATGDLYTVESSGNFRAQKFSGAALAASLFAPGDLLDSIPSGNNTPTDLAFDPSTNRILVNRGYAAANAIVASCPTLQRRILEFDTTGQLKDTHLACVGVGSSGPAVNGLAVRPSTGRAYTSTTQTAGATAHRVWVLDADGITPAIATVNPATAVSATGASLSGTVNPNSVDNSHAPTLWKLQYSRNGGDWTTAASGSIATPGTTPVPVTGSASDLSPNTLYRVRIVTQKPFGNPEIASAELTFASDAIPPEIRTTATQAVSATSASLSARINPHGTPTSYRFEWGEEGTFDHLAPVPDASAGNGPSFVLVTQELQGLRPDTTYQFRAVAISASEGPTVGPTRTFTTAQQPLANSASRAYELVSPADKIGGSGVGTWYAGVGSHGNSGIPAYDGDRFASAAYYGGTLADGGFSYATDWTFGERTASGWLNRPGFNRPGGFGSSEFAKAPIVSSASDDLSLTAWNANSQPRIFEEQAEVFGDFLPGGDALREWESGRWEIVAPLEQNQQVDSEIRTRLAADGGYAVTAGLIRGVAGPTDPTNPAFTGDPSDLVCPPGACNRNVYLDDVTAGLSNSFPGDGIRSLVNACTGVGPDRTAIPSVDGGGKLVAEECPAALTSAGRSARLISPRGASLSAQAANRGVISDDGSRVFFMSPDHLRGANNAACSGTGAAGTACPPQVYVRQRSTTGTVSTRWISRSAVVGQDATLTAAVVFEGATPDGDKVFFRTASPLTADDPNGGAQVPGGIKTGVPNANSMDLYMYDLPNGPDGDPATADADPGGGTLTRISAGPGGDSDGNVSTDPTTSVSLGALRAVGGDGSNVYFTTAAPLAGVPAPADGTITSPSGTVGQTATKNLYSYDASRAAAQRWRFVAQLPAASALGLCATRGAVIDADGLWAGIAGTGTNGLVELNTTGGNCVRSNSDGTFITFFTDGRLTADDPDTTTGDVYAYDSTSDELARLSAPQGGVGGSYACVTQGASVRCHGDPIVSAVSSRAPLSMVTDTDDRTVFFESASRLVAADHNDVYDVYQWHNGKLSLISTGAANAADALYRGNDRTGKNVYISTRDALTWQDHDTVLDIYTARVGGGIPEPAPPAACSLLGDACQPPANNRVEIDTRSADSGGSNVVPPGRVELTLAGPGAQAKRRAARTGVLPVRVRSNTGGSVSATATARIGKRTKEVGEKAVRFAAPGVKTIGLRLSRSARKQLAASGRLKVKVTVKTDGARSRSTSILLRKGDR